MKENFDTGFFPAVSRLRTEWGRAQAEWKDEAARKFEHEIWRDLDEEISRFVSALSEFESELADISNALDDSS